MRALISTFPVISGGLLGVNLGTALVKSVGAAMATLALWFQVFGEQGDLQKNPFYIIWALQKGKGPKKPVA